MKALALCLLLLGCGSTIDYPDCDIPKAGDSCSPVNALFHTEDRVRGFCDESGAIAIVSYLIYDEHLDVERYTSLDDKCFEDKTCYLLAALCR